MPCAYPGRPKLLAFAAVRLMLQADVVVHDNLAAPTSLDLDHRDHANTCVFDIGHLKDRKLDLNWTKLSLQ